MTLPGDILVQVSGNCLGTSGIPILIDESAKNSSFTVDIGGSNMEVTSATAKVPEQLIEESGVMNLEVNYKKNNKVMFISAERFMYQFVKSIKSNEMVKFKEYFRNTDILLIDDIQFISGKEAMQEEFFHTFNALLDKGSQIIVSADRAPNKLSRIQERIKSRFSGGLVVDIQKPDLELRKK